ncbi:MAG: pentapeptide repeat-containing protein, partial [Gloeomargarita sp. GMQP_bins_25]
LLMRWRSPTAADLRGADLRGANLTGAHLGGMYLLGVRCQGAILPNGRPYQFWSNLFPWD